MGGLLTWYNFSSVEQPLKASIENNREAKLAFLNKASFHVWSMGWGAHAAGESGFPLSVNLLGFKPFSAPCPLHVPNQRAEESLHRVAPVVCSTKQSLPSDGRGPEALVHLGRAGGAESASQVWGYRDLPSFPRSSKHLVKAPWSVGHCTNLRV